MAAQMDALSSFTFLTDSIPDWIKHIDGLSAHTTKRHTEFAAEYTRLLKHARPKKMKSPSLISHRSGDRKSEKENNAEAKSHISSSYPASDARLELNPLEAGNRYIFANARRPKKTTGGASVRSGASGPQKFRQRHAVVIYYDSHVQESFETMVKSISTARNNLRKGKKARVLSRGPMFPSFEPSSNRYNFHPTDLKRDILLAQFSVNPKSNTNVSPGSTTTSSAFDESSFDIADKDLEQAQNLCETAAHQFLRDGDSTLELRTTKEKLETVLTLATSVVEKLKEEERLQTELEEAETAVDEHDHEHRNEKLDDLTLPAIKAGPTMLDDHFAAIEVDDDEMEDSCDADFDITRYKAMMRPHNTVRV